MFVQGIIDFYCLGNSPDLGDEQGEETLQRIIQIFVFGCELRIHHLIERESASAVGLIESFAEYFGGFGILLFIPKVIAVKLISGKMFLEHGDHEIPEGLQFVLPRADTIIIEAKQFIERQPSA